MEIFELEKQVWDDNDFSNMGWHDTTIWSMFANSTDFEFILDLDYIFKWVHPNEEEKDRRFKFWVSPATMVFVNVAGVKIELNSQQGQIWIDGLYRENPQLTPNGKLTEHTYRFDCQQGEISITATGFKMFVRKKPELLGGQHFGLVQRQGVSFGRELTAL